MQIKLFFSPSSPYIRKWLVAAAEVGLADVIELLLGSTHPVTRDQSIVFNNPLGKIPTLITEDGQSLYDRKRFIYKTHVLCAVTIFKFTR